MVKPSQRKELAQQAISSHTVSIRLVCQEFSISETCYRYRSLLSSENEGIAEWLDWLLVSRQQILYENRQPIFCLKYTFCMKLNCL